MSTLFQAITRPADDFIEARTNLRNGRRAKHAAHRITLEDRTKSERIAPTTSYGSVDGASIAQRQEERQEQQQELAEAPNAVITGHQDGDRQVPKNIHAEDGDGPSPDIDEDADPSMALAPATSNESAPLLGTSSRPRSKRQRRSCMNLQWAFKRFLSSICCCFPAYLAGVDEEDEEEGYAVWNARHGIKSLLPGSRASGYERVRDEEDKPAAGNGIFSADPNVCYDVLYENQRGLFVFGTPFFSSQGLLNYDPPAWQDANFKYSPVDILTASVPDPSWEWVWRTWYIDMAYDIDDQGWSYSISFTSGNWHGAHVWFHSLVRRRRWIRKRQRVVVDITQASELAPAGVFGSADWRRPGGRKKVFSVVEGVSTEYFTVESSGYRARTRKQLAIANTVKSNDGSSMSPNLNFNYDDLGDDLSDEEAGSAPVTSIASLMHRMRNSRLDRRKIEAVEEFVKDGGEDIVLLASFMDQIIAFLIFQESRRELLRCLLHSYQQVRSRKGQRRIADAKENDNPARLHPGHVEIDTKGMSRKEIIMRRKALHNAIVYAKREIMKLDFYSDRKVSGREYAKADLLSDSFDRSDPSGASDSDGQPAVPSRDVALSEELARVEEEQPEDLNETDDFSDRGSSIVSDEDSSTTSRDKGKRPADYRIPLGEIRPDLATAYTAEQDRNATISTVRNKVLEFVSS